MSSPTANSCWDVAISIGVAPPKVGDRLPRKFRIASSWPIGPTSGTSITGRHRHCSVALSSAQPSKEDTPPPQKHPSHSSPEWLRASAIGIPRAKRSKYNNLMGPPGIAPSPLLILHRPEADSNSVVRGEELRQAESSARFLVASCSLPNQSRLRCLSTERSSRTPRVQVSSALPY